MYYDGFSCSPSQSLAKIFSSLKSQCFDLNSASTLRGWKLARLVVRDKSGARHASIRAAPDSSVSVSTTHCRSFNIIAASLPNASLLSVLSALSVHLLLLFLPEMVWLGLVIV
jgi:hypothetical protein